MQRLTGNFDGQNLDFGPMAQIWLALFFTLAMTGTWLFMPRPEAPVVLLVAAFIFVLAIKRPFWLCLAFLVLALFRIHEVFPILISLRLPLLFGLLIIGSLIFHSLANPSITANWPAQLKLLLIFLVLVSFDVLFIHRLSSDLFELLIWIGLITLSLAWFPTTTHDFSLLTKVIVITGLILAALTIQNKFLGFSRASLHSDFGLAISDANDLALLLLFPFAFSLTLLMYRSSMVDTVLGIAGASAIGLAIVFTKSRGGYLGLLTVTIPFFFQVMRSKALACVIIILFAGGLYSITGIAERLQGVTSARIDASSAGRLRAWRGGIDMALDRPFAGVGMYQFQSAMPGGKAAHSIWISVVAETGFPGLILFLSLIATTFRSLFRTASAFRQAQVPPIMRAVTAGFTLTLSGFCVAASFLNPTWSFNFYVVIGFSAALSRYVRYELLQPSQS